MGGNIMLGMSFNTTAIIESAKGFGRSAVAKISENVPDTGTAYMAKDSLETFGSMIAYGFFNILNGVTLDNLDKLVCTTANTLETMVDVVSGSTVDTTDQECGGNQQKLGTTALLIGLYVAYKLLPSVARGAVGGGKMLYNGAKKIGYIPPFLAISTAVGANYMGVTSQGVLDKGYLATQGLMGATCSVGTYAMQKAYDIADSSDTRMDTGEPTCPTCDIQTAAIGTGVALAAALIGYKALTTLYSRVARPALGRMGNAVRGNSFSSTGVMTVAMRDTNTSLGDIKRALRYHKDTQLLTGSAGLINLHVTRIVTPGNIQRPDSITDISKWFSATHIFEISNVERYHLNETKIETALKSMGIDSAIVAIPNKDTPGEPLKGKLYIKDPSFDTAKLKQLKAIIGQIERKNGAKLKLTKQWKTS
ncbi:hypothetical protein DID80_08410 [Candidatus Marinamargulisbacteria bacterium SCGC AAA071-K20]|nr:hypothetical protein DID80_08410 [Candidatus Marinamargulisbacteria bacterium SCGC AAA071-K20]